MSLPKISVYSGPCTLSAPEITKPLAAVKTSYHSYNCRSHSLRRLGGVSGGHKSCGCSTDQTYAVM